MLVEGDDHNEPVADAVRGMLDGHVVLDRRIAEGGRYPAVDILRRSPASPILSGHLSSIRHLRSLIARYEETRELRLMGAYTPGADLHLDKAVKSTPRI